MLNIATLFNRRIYNLFHGFKNTHKENKKSLFNNINLQRIVKLHPCLFYIVAYLGIPLGIMLAVFCAVYVAVTPLSLIMGWI